MAQINNYAKQIANLNDQISRMTGVGAGASPNDLLDQRDQLVSELNKIVGVEVSVQDGGTYNLTMANGYTLVQGSTARQLAAVPPAPTRRERLSLMSMRPPVTSKFRKSC